MERILDTSNGLCIVDGIGTNLLIEMAMLQMH